MSEHTDNKPSSSDKGAGKRQGGNREGKPRNFGNKKPGGFGGKGKGFGGKGRNGEREGDRGNFRGAREGGRGGERGGKPFEKREGGQGKRFDKGGKPFEKRDGNRGPREDKPFEKREGTRGDRRDGRPFEKKYYSYEGGSDQKREGKRDFKGGKPNWKRDDARGGFRKDREGGRDGKPFEKRGDKPFGKRDGRPFEKREGDRGGFRKDREDKRFDKRFDKPEKGFDVGNEEKSIPEEFLTFEEIADLRALPGTEVTHKEYGRGVIDACDATGLMRVKFHTVGLKVYNCEKALKTDTLRIRRPEQ